MNTLKAKKFLKKIELNEALAMAILNDKKGFVAHIHKFIKSDPFDRTQPFGFIYIEHRNACIKYKVQSNNRHEFINHFLSDDNFMSMYNEYKSSGFKLNLKPSITLFEEGLGLKPKNVKWEIRKSRNVCKGVKLVSLDPNGKPDARYISFADATNQTGMSTYAIKRHLHKKVKEPRFEYYDAKIHDEYFEGTLDNFLKIKAMMDGPMKKLKKK